MIHPTSTLKGHELCLFVCATYKHSPAWLAGIQISACIQTEFILTTFTTGNNKQSLKTDFRDCIVFPFFSAIGKDNSFTVLEHCNACIHPTETSFFDVEHPSQQQLQLKEELLLPSYRLRFYANPPHSILSAVPLHCTSKHNCPCKTSR